MKKYFISYNFSIPNQRTGSGCTILTFKKSITNMDDIISTINFIKEQDKSLKRCRIKHRIN